MKIKFTRLLVLITIVLASTTLLHAQNLVPNYSFEVMDTCPMVSQITLAHPWNSATSGTPDLFNSSCASQNLQARTGVGSSGVYLLNTFTDNREYIQAPLTSPLLAEKTYCVSFWVKRVNYRYATNRIGAYFSLTEIDSSFFTGVLPRTPQVDNPSSNMLSSSSWMEISGSFVAQGGEAYVIIGSFVTDDETDTLVANSGSSSRVSFYAIDDVSVTDCNSGINDHISLEDLNIYPSPASDYLNVQLSPSMIVKSMRLLSVSGKEIQNIDLLKNVSGGFVLNVSSLPSGIYFLSLHTQDGIVNRKVVIEN